MSEPEHIIAIDPGMTTGLAWCSIRSVLDVDGSPVSGIGKKDQSYHELFEWGEITGDVAEQAWKLGRGIVNLRARVVISESSDYFVIRGGKALQKHSLVPIKLSGAIEALVAIMNGNLNRTAKTVAPEQIKHMKWFPVTRVEQGPGQAKGVITDAILRVYGFPLTKREDPEGKGMSPHERDAIRHLLLFIRRMYASGGKNPFAELIRKEINDG